MIIIEKIGNTPYIFFRFIREFVICKCVVLYILKFIYGHNEQSKRRQQHTNQETENVLR